MHAAGSVAPLRQRGAERGLKVVLAAGDLADRIDELGRRGLLQEVAAGAGGEAQLHVGRVVDHRQDQDRRVRVALVQALDYIGAAVVRQDEVRDDHVGFDVGADGLRRPSPPRPGRRCRPGVRAARGGPLGRRRDRPSAAPRSVGHSRWSPSLSPRPCPLPDRHLKPNPGSRIGRRLDDQLAADELRALAHPDQSETRARPGRRPGRTRRPLSSTIVETTPSRRRSRIEIAEAPRVLQGVVDRLLDDAVHDRLRLRIDRAGRRSPRGGRP